MTVKEKIINQLLKENEYSLEGKEIVYNSNSIANSIGCNPKSIKRFKDELFQFKEITKVGNGERNNKIKFTNPTKYKYNYSYLVEDIETVKEKDLSDSELKVLGYITKRFNERDNEQEYGFSDLKHIADNCKISPMTVSKIVKKLVNEGLIEIIKGNWKEKKATQFKVLFPTVNKDNNTANNTNNNSSNNTNNITVNIPDTNPILQEILSTLKDQSKRIDLLEKQNSDLKDSIINLYNRFNVVEKVADVLLKYIEEVEHDLDNVYILNNIQRSKPQCKCSISDIRNIIDKTNK